MISRRCDGEELNPSRCSTPRQWHSIWNSANNCSLRIQAVRRKAVSKMRQEQLPLAIISKGLISTRANQTVHKGEDLDIPTFVRRRRGVELNVLAWKQRR